MPPFFSPASGDWGGFGVGEIPMKQWTDGGVSLYDGLILSSTLKFRWVQWNGC